MLFPCPSHQKHSFHDPKEARTRSPFSQSSSCELSVMNVLPSADASRTNRYRTTCPPGRRQHASCLVTYCVTLFFSSSPSRLTLCSLFFFLFLHITLSGMWMHREAEGTFSFVSLLLLIVIKREGEKKKKESVDLRSCSAAVFLPRPFKARSETLVQHTVRGAACAEGIYQNSQRHSSPSLHFTDWPC